jgi:hypothetical protein
MRDGFCEIISGWTRTSGMADLTERIDRATEWTKTNRPLEADEEAVVQLMIAVQTAWGITLASSAPSLAGRRTS